MDRGLFVNKKDYEALQRTLSQNKSMLDASRVESKKLHRQTILYANQCNIIIAEMSIKIQQLSREKMLAESTKNMIEKEKKNAQLEIVTQIRNMMLQKISICR